VLFVQQVQTELRTVKEERDSLQQQLQSQLFTSQQLEGGVKRTFANPSPSSPNTQTIRIKVLVAND